MSCAKPKNGELSGREFCHGSAFQYSWADGSCGEVDRARKSAARLNKRRNRPQKGAKNAKTFCEFCAFLWLFPPHQNSSFSANWSRREVVAVLVICPADAL